MTLHLFTYHIMYKLFCNTMAIINYEIMSSSSSYSLKSGTVCLKLQVQVRLGSPKIQPGHSEMSRLNLISSNEGFLSSSRVT